LEENVTVLDGATIGSECVVGASAVIHGQIPDRSVVAPEERLVVMPRATFSKQTGGMAEPPQIKRESRAGKADSLNRTDSEADPRIVALVLRAVAEVNRMLPDGSRLREDTSCPLVQPDGPLDSLGVINLLVAVEDQVEAEFGRRLNLTQVDTPEDSSPLSTVGSLAKFVAERLKK
jgi:acyl carrier protein